LGYINFFTPLAFIIAGLCSAYFFRKLGFAPWICALGGIAAALNGNFFSNGCWGLPSRSLSLGMTFLALAALQSSLGRWTWLKVVLAGLDVGMSISEGGDNGAFFSLFVAAYAVVLSLVSDSGGTGARAGKGVARVVVTAVFAAVLAAQSLNIFANVAVKGIVGTQQDSQTKEQKSLGATLWSLPKAETLRVIIPGLYGYRMDTPEGGDYWGGVGAQPGYPTSRYSGAGEYAGVIVMLIAAFAVAQSLAKKNNPYSPGERRLIWFWAIAALVALLFAWGRFAPFYRLLYALPYFSTIRNPMKLMHPFHMAVIILFAYGLHGLGKRFTTPEARPVESLTAQLKAWWRTAQGFDRAWIWICLTLFAASLGGLVIYAGLKPDVVKYLTEAGFAMPDKAREIANFSVREVGWYVLMLLISIAVVFAVMSGHFRGARARWAALLIGVVLVVDLARANAPWIQYYNYRERYATNPVLDVLRDTPQTHRVTSIGLNAGGQGQQMQQAFQQFYHGEWLQHEFQYYNIQSLDVAQMPRVPEDYAAFNGALGRTPFRLWQVTNARYMLGLAPMADALNQQLDPTDKRFKTRMLFTLVQNDKYITAVESTNGPFSLVEFTGALPRAKLYARWQVQTNSEAALANLASATFDPADQVIVSDPVAPPAGAAANPPADAVQFTAYSPRHITFKTSAANPTVMLLNDRYHPAWKVKVDNKPAPLLRCNFIARGVSLAAGDHAVEFTFEPPLLGFWITAGAVAFGLLLCIVLAILGHRAPSAAASTGRGVAGT